MKTYNALEQGRLVDVIHINRLTQHFDDKTLNDFKKSMYEQFGFNGELEYLHKSLHAMSHLISKESLQTLKTKTSQMAQNAVTTNGKSVWNKVISHYNNFCSKLPSNTIDKISNFLTKKESIKFGYLNKQLYIETQKASYLFSRQHDVLELNEKKFKRIMKSPYNKCNLFNHSLPTHLYLSSIDNHFFAMSTSKYTTYKSVFVSPWFKGLFTRVKDCICRNHAYLSFIPLNVLFGVNGNVNVLELSLEQPKQEPKPPNASGSFFFGSNFSTNYEQAFKDTCEDRDRSMRQLFRNLHKYKSNHVVSSKINNLVLSNFAQSMVFEWNGFYKHLTLKNISVVINKMDQLNYLFHSKLESITLGNNVTVSTDVDLDDAMGIRTNTSKNEKNKQLVAVIKERFKNKLIKLVVSADTNLKSLFDILKICNLEENINVYQLNIDASIMPRENGSGWFLSRQAQNPRMGMNDLMFRDFSRFTKLNKIRIVILDENVTLYKTQELFDFFNKNREKIINEMTQIKIIEIGWDGFNYRNGWGGWNTLQPFSNELEYPSKMTISLTQDSLCNFNKCNTTTVTTTLDGINCSMSDSGDSIEMNCDLTTKSLGLVIATTVQFIQSIADEYCSVPIDIRKDTKKVAQLFLKGKSIRLKLQQNFKLAINDSQI